MNYEAVIGLEVHAQMLTDTKIFCGCSTKFGADPNSQTCPICIGMPGVLPVLNKKALEFAIKTGLATNCKIQHFSRFARKNYFYPDLPKGYQISQYELPICEHGYIEIVSEGNIKKIGITRIHMEEDAGKNIHESFSINGSYSFVDLNRAGVPLMEIVSEPDISTPSEAVEYMKKLRTILRYLDVCDGNMEQGSLRCDANVSVRLKGKKELGTKVEIKNINSFKFVEKALEYEIKRQIKVLEEGGNIIQETRLWNSEKGITESMRGKEEAHDYRYFPEPDLVPIKINDEWLDLIKQNLPELPDIKRERFINNFGLASSDADLLTSEKALANWFEEAVNCGANPKTACNWIKGELLRILNEENKSIEQCNIKPAQLAGMLKLIEDKTISGKIAKTVFEEIYKTGKDADTIVKEKGLVQITNTDEIESIIDEVLMKSPGEVERYKNGDKKLLGFFVGQIMKITKGKANPQIVNEILNKKLS